MPVYSTMTEQLGFWHGHEPVAHSLASAAKHTAHTILIGRDKGVLTARRRRAAESLQHVHVRVNVVDEGVLLEILGVEEQR